MNAQTEFEVSKDEACAIEAFPDSDRSVRMLAIRKLSRICFDRRSQQIRADVTARGNSGTAGARSRQTRVQVDAQ